MKWNDFSSAVWAVNVLIAAKSYWLLDIPSGWEQISFTVFTLGYFGASVSMFVKRVRER